MLKEYGIRSLAMQNLARFAKAVVEFSDTTHEHYDNRVHVFGMLSGILEPSAATQTTPAAVGLYPCR